MKDRKEPQQDMHRSVIVGMLKAKGCTITELSRRNGLHKNTLSNALRQHYPKAEKIIAEALEMKPQEIWPSRY